MFIMRISRINAPGPDSYKRPRVYPNNLPLSIGTRLKRGDRYYGTVRSGHGGQSLRSPRWALPHYRFNYRFAPRSWDNYWSWTDETHVRTGGLVFFDQRSSMSDGSGLISIPNIGIGNWNWNYGQSYVDPLFSYMDGVNFNYNYNYGSGSIIDQLGSIMDGIPLHINYSFGPSIIDQLAKIMDGATNFNFGTNYIASQYTTQFTPFQQTQGAYLNGGFTTIA